MVPTCVKVGTVCTVVGTLTQHSELTAEVLRRHPHSFTAEQSSLISLLSLPFCAAEYTLHFVAGLLLGT